MKEVGGSSNLDHLLYHPPPLNQGPNPSHQQSTATPTMAANVWPQQVGLNYWLPAYYYYYQWQQLLLQSLAGRPLQNAKDDGQIRGSGDPNWEQGKGEEKQGKGKEEQVKELPLSLEAAYKCVVESPAWLPPGWITEMQTRRSGSSAGTRDKQYYKDLMSGRRFRSRNEVIKFLLTGKGRVRCQRKRRVLGITSSPATAQLCRTSPLKDRHLLEAPCAGQLCQLAEDSFNHLAVSPVVDATRRLFQMESPEEKPNTHASSHVAERPLSGVVQQHESSFFREKSNRPAASHILMALIETQIQDKRPSNDMERYGLGTHVPAQIHDKRASNENETQEKGPSHGVERLAWETHVPISNEAGIHVKRLSNYVERHALETDISAPNEAQIHEKRLNNGAKRHALGTYVLPLIEAQIIENRPSNIIVERHTLETYHATQLSGEDRKPTHIIETSVSGVPDGVSQCDEERTNSCVSKPPSVTQPCRNGWLGQTPCNAVESHLDNRLQNSFLRARTNNAQEQPIWEILDGVYQDEKMLTVENTIGVMTGSVRKASSLLQPCESSMPRERCSNAAERLAGDMAQLHNDNFLGEMLSNAMRGPVLGSLTRIDLCANSLPRERLNNPIKSPGSEAFGGIPLCVKSLFGGKPNSALQGRVSEPLSAVQSCETSLRGEMPYNAIERHVFQAHTSGHSLPGKALNNAISSSVLRTPNEVHLSSFRERNNGARESCPSRTFSTVIPFENASREKANQSREISVLEALNGSQVPDKDLPLPRLDSGTAVRASGKAPPEIPSCATALCREKDNSGAMERSNLEGLNSHKLCGKNLYLERSDNASIEKSVMETSTTAGPHKKSLLKVQPRAGQEKLGLGASKGAQLCKRPFSKRPVLKAAYTVILACPAPLSTIHELRRAQGHKQASSSLGVSSIAVDKEGQHNQASSGLEVSNIAPDKEAQHKQARLGLAVSNIPPNKEEDHKQASSGLGVCNIAPDKEGQHKQSSSGLEASNIARLGVSNIAPDKEGECKQASSGLGASNIAPDKEGQHIQAIPGLEVSSMAPDKEEQLHTQPSERTCKFKGLFGSYKAAISGQKRPAQQSPSKLPVQKKIKFYSPKKGEDKQGSRLWQWLQQSGTFAKKQDLVKQEMHTLNSNAPTIAEQRCMIMQPADKMVSSCSGMPPASGKEREIGATNIDASMHMKMQPDYAFIYSGKEVPRALVKAREIEAANVDASRGMKMQPANTTICYAKEVSPALGNAREIQTVKMDAHSGKEMHASPNNAKVGKTLQSYQQLVIHPSMMNVQSSAAQALPVNPWLRSTSFLEIGSQAAESCTVLGSEKGCLPHLAREETQSTQELGRGVVRVSQHQRVHPAEVRWNVGRDREMQALMLNAQSSASQALQDNAQLPSANACFTLTATGLKAGELCSGRGCFPQLAREETQSAQMCHILGNLHFGQIDNRSGCVFTQLGDVGHMQNPTGSDRGSSAHTQMGKSTGLDLIHNRLDTGNHPGCFFTQCGDVGPVQTPMAGDIGSTHTQLDKKDGLDQIQTTPLGTDILQVAAQTHSPLVHNLEFIRETGESGTQLAVREQEEKKKKKREAQRRLEAILYPKLDLSKLSPGLSSRQKAKVVQKFRVKHGRELLATLGRQLCQRALQQGETVTNEKLATPSLQLGTSPKI